MIQIRYYLKLLDNVGQSMDEKFEPIKFDPLSCNIQQSIQMDPTCCVWVTMLHGVAPTWLICLLWP